MWVKRAGARRCGTGQAAKRLRPLSSFIRYKKEMTSPLALELQGGYDPQNHHVKLEPQSWNNRPDHHHMIGLLGVVDQNFETFGGELEAYGCEQFSLKKSSSYSLWTLVGKVMELL